MVCVDYTYSHVCIVAYMYAQHLGAYSPTVVKGFLIGQLARAGGAGGGPLHHV